MRKIILVMMLVVVLLIGTSNVWAQQATATPSASQGTGAVQIFVVICENQAVVNFTGNMPAGFDVFYQVFSSAGGAGNALTSFRQVQVDGAYAFSETIPYTTGSTVPTGGTASLRVMVGRESNPSSRTINTTVDDIQDGCNNPQNPVGTSIDLGATAPTSGVTSASGGILSPFGGVINPPAPPATAIPDAAVVIGARTSPEAGRSQTPGVIFAECNQYLDRANPGVLYDTDKIVLFWSWFAKTPELVQEHIDNAGYAVGLNSVGLPTINVGPIEQRTSDFWVFYTADIGQLEPGSYRVDFNLIWGKTISDGYDEYGPDTENPEVNSNCNFTVQKNPYGLNEADRYNRLFGPRASS